MRGFTASLSGPDHAATFALSAKSALYAIAPPAELMIDQKILTEVADWPRQVGSAIDDGRACWLDHRKMLGLRPKSDLVIIGLPNLPIALDTALALLEPLPFEICALGAVFFDEWIAADYERWGFSRGHISHGWACAFRGPGHGRLVSRRWLDFGPWRVIRRPDDTTFIQFHDLAITDPAEAYQQAKVGHERMGCSRTGGFIQQIPQWMLDDVRGLYLAADRRLEIVVPPGVPVEQGSMLNACAMRLHYRLHPTTPEPVERVAFVFVDEAEARSHLHELWLRELECWVADGRGKRRLDADYHPAPDPPAWVKRLGAG